jgi:DNA (cytosine-5)-methyltransferase 1
LRGCKVNIVDLFAGGGGASLGIQQALGVSPAVAVNHDPAAIEMHARNHRGTLHLCEDVFQVTPFRPRRRSIDLLWASPNCTHFSRAKGGQPKDTGIRLLAWVVVEWARAVHPRVIALENVMEFEQWGPLDEEGRQIEAREGETFREFVSALNLAGYRVEWRVLNAADYGAPTSRKRLFLVARCDGEPIRWPEPTHGPGRALPWRTAAECIDWSLPVPSIFDRPRELAPATQRRIAEGVRRYVLQNPRPFIVGVGGRAGQSPPVPVDRPLGTITAKGDRALVSAFLARHYGVSKERAARGDLGVVGQSLRDPIGTVTARDHHSLVTAELEPRRPDNSARVAAWLCKYYGTGCGQELTEPLHTIPTHDRFGLVTVHLDGEPYVVTDIGLRMLQPRELATAQGFPTDYILTGNKREQVARVGNSVAPPVAAALVRSLFGLEPIREAA